MNKDIGTRIRKIRLNKEIDVKKIADEIGIRDTSFSKIEREGSNSVDTLSKIASALGVKITEFFEDSYLVAEPKESMGQYVTREEWLQYNKDQMTFLKNEFAKLHEGRPVKKDSYTLKNKSRKGTKK